MRLLNIFKIKDFTFIIFALISFNFTSWSQVIQYEKHFLEEYSIESQNLIYTSDEEYHLSGFTWPTDAFSNGIDFYTLKVDKDGNKLESRTYGDSLSNYLQSSMELSNGNILLVGYSFDSTGDVKNTLLLTNPKGDSLWMINYGLGSLPQKSIETMDGNIVVVGSNRSSGTRKSTMSKVDYDGNVIWEKIIGGSDENIALDVIQFANGDFIVCGWLREESTSGYLMKVSSDGELIWDKIITLGGESELITDLEITNDGNMLIAGFTENLSLQNYYSVPFLVKMNLDGNILWQKEYTGMDPSWGGRITQTIDNNIFLTGNTYDSEINLWLMKLNSEGEEDYHLLIEDESDNWNSAFDKLEKRAFGIMSSTSKYDSTSNRQKRGIYFVKLYDDTILSNGERLLRKINITPNPANHFVNIDSDLEFEKIVITSVAGKKVFESLMNNLENYRINTSNILSGTYIISLITKTNEIFTKKIIIN